MFARDYQEIGVESPKWHQLGTTLQVARLPLKLASLEISSGCSNVEIYADPLLEKVFYNLMENSLRHVDASTEIHISCKGDDVGLTILYEDNGPGISDEDKENIFLKGYGKNTGLGLFLIREILATTGISIRETGEPGHGVRFEILVPKEKFRYTG
jgi:signal transduction histidine kinase